MIFDYDLEQKYQQSIAIDDFGNTCLECENLDGFFYYLIIATSYGQSRLLGFGPVEHNQTTSLIEDFKLDFTSLKFNEKKLVKEIKTFINDKQKKIIFINEIPIDMTYKQIPDIITAFNNAINKGDDF